MPRITALLKKSLSGRFLVWAGNGKQNCDVSPDGKRVAMFPAAEAADSAGSLHATFALNFLDEMRLRVPPR